MSRASTKHRHQNRSRSRHLSQLGVENLETAKANGQEPYAWLRHTLERLPQAAAIEDFEAFLIVDNYASHIHAAVKAWLAKHPCFHIHFTPTSSSWMNMVERFFRDITVYLRDGSFSSARELESSITTFMALRDAQPTLYV